MAEFDDESMEANADKPSGSILRGPGATAGATAGAAKARARAAA